MTMGEFRERTNHVPDDWPLRVCGDEQQLFDIRDYLICAELGDQLVFLLEEDEL
jgi:hypothetical protein